MSTTSYYGYYINLSYTASSSCATPWVYTTTANAYIPPMITPTPTSVSTRYSQYEAFGETSTYYYAFIDPTFLPTSSLASISSNYAPYFTTYCTVPSSYTTGVVSGGDSGSDDSSSSSDSSSSDGCRPASYSDSFYYGDDGFQTTYVCPDGSHYVSPLPLPNY